MSSYVTQIVLECLEYTVDINILFSEMVYIRQRYSAT